MRQILILGGTSEAYRLASVLAKIPEHQVITSFAGSTEAPLLPPGEIRIGGFGGVEGLIDYLCSHRIDFLINATHPFAAQMSHHALEAHRATQIPMLRLMRPPWIATPKDRWIRVKSAEEAASSIKKMGGIVFLTLGVKDLASFQGISEARFLARVIQIPDPCPLPDCHFIVARGPFDLASEMELMRHHRVTLLVAKQSGGNATYAKIEAAKNLGIKVIMLERPRIADEPGCPIVSDIESAIAWIAS